MDATNELVRAADDVLGSSYAKHLIREETQRQVELWIKWRVLPVTAILGAVVALFGWKADSLYTALQARINMIESAVTDLPIKIKGAQDKVEAAANQIEASRNLIDSAREGARSGTLAAQDGARTVQAGLALVQGAGANLIEAQKLLGAANLEVIAAKNSVVQLDAE